MNRGIRKYRILRNLIYFAFFCLLQSFFKKSEYLCPEKKGFFVYITYIITANEAAKILTAIFAYKKTSICGLRNSTFFFLQRNIFLRNRKIKTNQPS